MITWLISKIQKMNHEITDFDIMKMKDRMIICVLMPLELLFVKVAAYLCTVSNIDIPAIQNIKNFVPNGKVMGIIYDIFNYIDGKMFLPDEYLVSKLCSYDINLPVAILIDIVLCILISKDLAFVFGMGRKRNFVFRIIIFASTIRFMLFGVFQEISIKNFLLSLLIAWIICRPVQNMDYDDWGHYTNMDYEQFEIKHGLNIRTFVKKDDTKNEEG